MSRIGLLNKLPGVDRLARMATSPAGLATGLGGLFGANLVREPVGDMLQELAYGRQDQLETWKRAREQRLGQQLRAAEREALTRRMAMASARLAAVNPQLYNEVLAGRRLPQGAVVLGGIPRTDLLQELAYDLASGQHKPETSAEEQLLATLGA